MKHKTYLLILLMAVTSVCKAQNVLVPGDNIFAEVGIKNGKTEMAYFAASGAEMVEIGSFTFNVVSNNKTVSIYSSLQFLNSPDLWIDSCIADVNTFKPIYRSSFNKDNNYVLNYAKEIKGYYLNKKTQKRNIIQEPIKEAFFDNYAYSFFLGLLPLQTGYKKDLVVYDYKPENKNNITKTRIEEVKSNIYVSNLTGEHKVWQVSVFEEAADNKSEYYIDKDSRKIWKVEMLVKGQKLVLINKELDYNPFVNKFNKEETLKLIKNGSAVITGQVFARDNQNEGALSGIAVFNINKKQFAKTGTSVVLIPYTDFFKEWMKLNEVSRKKGKAIPLPQEATECIKVTSVYDNQGHFEFVNLMPGDYLVYTEFGYVHTSIKSEVVGYTDTYINGMYQGSSANTKSYGYSGNAGATVKKVVTIEKAGEKVDVKLKKTL